MSCSAVRAFAFTALAVITAPLFSQSTCEIDGLYAPPVLSFACGDTQPFYDYDYATVQIGTQCWFSENLRSERYLNGDLIPGNQDGSDWATTNTGLQCYYDNDTANLAVYGRLYNWYAVESGGLCPSGWHVPSDDEWKTMEMHLGMSASDANSTGWRSSGLVGNQLKEAGEVHWNSPNTGADNLSGFTGMGAGFRVGGGFSGLRTHGYFWSASPSGGYAWVRALHGSYAGVYRGNYDSLRHGFAIRCARD
jgi:uncharacterized protein (TIGR02145 family)